jgi:hypothetical protein
MTHSRNSDLKTRTLNKIQFLENQLVSLDHYLPETYEYIMRVLEVQKRTLAELEVEEHFTHIDQNESLINSHPRDTRPIGVQQENLIDLNILQDVLEETIGSYVLQNPENIYDEENEQVLRVLEFSRGLKNHHIVMAPDGFIRWLSPKFPSALLLEIHNALVGVEILDAPDGVFQ